MKPLLGSCLTGRARMNPYASGLIAYWPLTEASGNRADSGPNSLTLTEVGTLGQADGLVHTKAALYDMTADMGLSRARADAALLNFSSSTPFTYALWCYLTSNVGGPDSPNYYRYLLDFNGGSYNSGGYTLQTTADAQLYYQLGKTGGLPLDTRHTGLLLTTNTWSFIVWTHSAGVFNTYLNAGTPDTYTLQYAFTAATNNNFYIGIKFGTQYVFDGRIGPVAAWNRVLTTAEIDYLYNAGSGRAYGG